MMFLIHGQAATYQVGWSNQAGRDLNAHNLLLWQAMLELRQRGIKRLDLGGVNTTRSAGLARFKIGTGGQVLKLPGTYLA
jgi:lipid II:glycine glycyltransferase (peptidoglycan interpeptide bridge formation enzyme)